MDLYTFFKIILRNWWLIALTVVFTAGTAAYFVSLRQPVFQATARVVLKPSPSLTDPNLQINAQNSLERRTLINTLAQIAQTSAMHERVAVILNVAPAVVQAADLRAIVVPDANLIEIRARSTDAALAAEITNLVAAELGKEVPQQTFRMDIIDRALPPTAPVEPQPRRIVTLAIVFGLALGVGLALLGYVAEAIRGTSSVVDSDTSTGSLPPAEDARDPAQTQPFFTRS